MKRLSFMLCLLSSAAWASDDLSCEKKPMNDHVVHCKSKKNIEVSLISINGGECTAAAFHKRISAGSSFDIPGSKECFHTRSITLSVDGTVRVFAPL